MTIDTLPSHVMEHVMEQTIRGNIVVSTGNPFDSAATENEEKQATIWLGRNLCILLDHVLRVDTRGFIRHLGPANEYDFSTGSATLTTTTLLELSPHEFLCPGFIDLHIHAPQFVFTGTATDRPLLGPDGWLCRYAFPAEHRLRDDLPRTQEVYRQVVQSTLRHGTTTALYFATLHATPCKLLVDAVLRQGQRALIGKVCMDRAESDNDDGADETSRSYCQSLRQNFNETIEVMDYIYQRAGKRIPNSHSIPLPTVLPVVTPRFLPTCSPDLLRDLGNLARQHECHITSHLSESHDEVALSRQLDATDREKKSTTDTGEAKTGRSDTEIFDSHGLLTPLSVYAHGVHVSPSDLDLLQQRQASIAHCPLSNFFFAGAILPCRHLLERGVKVGLGSDVAGGYSPSMLMAARMAVIASQALQQQQQQQANHADNTSAVLDYRHAFYMATLGGAAALGLDDRIGTFRVGMEFDAIVLSPNNNIPIFADTDTTPDIFQKLCVLGDDRNVTKVYVQGRQVVP